MADVPRVLLDSTALVGAAFGRSGPFEHLLREAADQRVEVIVPEVVVAETVFVYRRELFHVRNALEELPSLMRAAGYGWDLLQRPVLRRQMESELRNRLGKAGISPAKAPPLDADALIERILSRRKPTKPLRVDEQGRELRDQVEGFRDQLIWEHVRKAAEDGPLVFVTDNTHDFGSRKTRSGGRAQLHPELIEDLEADHSAKGASGQVDLVLDVETFVREYLRNEDVAMDMERLLEEGAGELAANHIRRLIEQDGLTMDRFIPPVAVQSDVEEATLTSLGEPVEIEILDVYLESKEGEPRDYGVTFRVTGEGSVDWLVTAPSPWDLDAFVDLVEGDALGGGFIQDWDSSPVEVTAYGRYRPSDETWRDLEVEPAEQTAEEGERRQREHDEWLIVREQELGLRPSDAELAAWEERGA